MYPGSTLSGKGEIRLEVGAVMKCPKCQRENREGAMFCKRCGNRLEAACPQCGNMNEPDSTFCDKCGHDATLTREPIPPALSFEEKLDKIQRYLPGGLAETAGLPKTKLVIVSLSQRGEAFLFRKRDGQQRGT